MPQSRTGLTTVDRRRPPCPGHRQHPRGWLAGALLVALAATTGALSSARAATIDLPAETQAVLVEAVAAAHALDFYNARCRGDDSGRHSDFLNKQLARRLHLTIITVEDEVFPERSFRGAQKRLGEDAAELLRQAGGCAGAKDAGLPETLGARYRKAMADIEALP